MKFHAPPLTPQTLAAAKLISPEMPFDDTSETSRQKWETIYNDVTVGELDVLFDLFDTLNPKTILEIGPGLGRTLIYLSQWWPDAQFHAYEGNGTTSKYTMSGPRFEDSWCGNITTLADILEYNGIHNVEILDAAHHQLADLPGPYDLIYAFYSIGFHWDIKHFWNDLLPLLSDTGTATFMTPPDYQPTPVVGINQQLIDYPTKGLPRFLIVNKITNTHETHP